MTRFRCDTCLGEYTDTQRDTRPYFHVCAPVFTRTIKDNVQSDMYRGERPNKRDERPTEDGKSITAEGRGRTEV